MQAVILTGGLGTRLRPITLEIPKGLVEVRGRPFLEHLVLYLKRFDIRDIVLLTGYLGDRIEAYFGDGSDLGVGLRYSREDRPLGTGGALKAAFGLLDDVFFLFNGDTLLPSDYNRMRWDFENSPTLVMLSAFPAAPPRFSPNLKLGANGLVAGYSRGGKGEGYSWVDAGVSLVRKGIERYFPAEEQFSLEEVVFPRLIEAGRLAARKVEEKFYDIGTPERIKEFEEYLEKVEANGID